MLRVETIGKIRRRGLRDGESVSGLARSLQLARIEAIAPLVQAMAEGRNVSTTLRQLVFEFRLGLARFSWAG